MLGGSGQNVEKGVDASMQQFSNAKKTRFSLNWSRGQRPPPPPTAAGGTLGLLARTGSFTHWHCVTAGSSNSTVSTPVSAPVTPAPTDATVQQPTPVTQQPEANVDQTGAVVVVAVMTGVAL